MYFIEDNFILSHSVKGFVKFKKKCTWHLEIKFVRKSAM